MRLSTIILTLILGVSSVTAQTAKPKYRLTWQDHFRGKTFDSRSWTKIPRSASADWKRYMSPADSLYDVRKGKLILRGAFNTNLEADTAQFVTGGLYTKHKRTVKYGKVEVRAKLGRAQGAWPAIWMLPDEDIKWPHGGEIDIMEHLNHDSIVYQTIHTNYTVRLKQTDNPPHGKTHPIDRDGFHTYAVELLHDSIVFSVNGDRYFTYPRIQTDKEGQYPFDRPYYLLIDMQTEGSWVGKAIKSELPVEMEIDWVKMYDLVE